MSKRIPEGGPSDSILLEKNKRKLGPVVVNIPIGAGISSEVE